MARQKLITIPTDKLYEIYPEIEGMSIDETLEFMADREAYYFRHMDYYSKSEKALEINDRTIKNQRYIIYGLIFTIACLCMGIVQ